MEDEADVLHLQLLEETAMSAVHAVLIDVSDA